jgi:hypothetical protein
VGEAERKLNAVLAHAAPLVIRRRQGHLSSIEFSADDVASPHFVRTLTTLSNDFDRSRDAGIDLSPYNT